MLKVTEYEGAPYTIGVREKVTRTDYIKFEWDTGYLDLKMAFWERLSKRRKEAILRLGNPTKK